MLILTLDREGIEVVDHGGPATPWAKQVQTWPRKAELVCGAMNHLDHTLLSVPGTPEIHLSFPITADWSSSKQSAEHAHQCKNNFEIARPTEVQYYRLFRRGG
ncbi:uncharacterized protein LOC120642593 [Panicum virgatum]|uniref:Uncharacterized protein n=1 Tax=Panicum virgatum TaxID=38727 RepID=A0A8T0QI00_PANVG|nr:uncharacterized protein LOC120642593 [Panicum virgatum]KAG2573322.1 hypothetical protein PVAP13_7KG241500 [Panicum virgatum]KAG2573323.1 hypothetical protein PVAP13_7KG241500 [Panicum virgatum]